MSMEAQGKTAEAHTLFKQAWDIAADNTEAFVAAHYLARNQVDPRDNLKWNQVALNKALQIADGKMKGHYPSLYLNVGKSFENLGDLSEAKHHYQLAADHSQYLPAGPYGEMIRSGIAQGLKRAGLAGFSIHVLDELINSWCERKDLKPLSFILPAYVGYLGAESDRNKLISALSYLSATRCLNKNEQEKTDGLITELASA